MVAQVSIVLNKTVVNTLTECSSHLQRQIKLYLNNIIGRCSHDTIGLSLSILKSYLFQRCSRGKRITSTVSTKRTSFCYVENSVQEKSLILSQKYQTKIYWQKFLNQNLILKPYKLKGKKILGPFIRGKIRRVLHKTRLK